MPFSRYKIFIPVPALLIAIVSCTHKEETATKSKSKMNMLKAEAYIVKPQSFSNDFTASGTLLPNEDIEVHPEISGRITSISFREGSNVHKGQTLVQLYDADIRAQIQKLRAQKQLQLKTQNRQKELLDIGGISKQEYEATQTQVSSIDADIAFAEAQLRATRIVAPFDGTIGLRNISTGAVVSPATVIATLRQTHPLKMDFSIPDRYRKAIYVDKVVFFSVRGIDDTLSGKISAIEPGADLSTRTIRVRAIVPNPGNKLVAGSFANIRIPFETDNSTLLVPSQSVIPSTRDKQVAIVENGKARLVTVTLGTRTSDKVEILTGLQEGDTVITTGIMQVKPGMEVKIAKLRE